MGMTTTTAPCNHKITCGMRTPVLRRCLPSPYLLCPLPHPTFCKSFCSPPLVPPTATSSYSTYWSPLVAYRYSCGLLVCDTGLLLLQLRLSCTAAYCSCFYLLLVLLLPPTGHLLSPTTGHTYHPLDAYWSPLVAYYRYWPPTGLLLSPPLTSYYYLLLPNYYWPPLVAYYRYWPPTGPAPVTTLTLLLSPSLFASWSCFLPPTGPRLAWHRVDD